MGNAALSSGPWAKAVSVAPDRVDSQALDAADPRSPIAKLEALTSDLAARGYIHVRGEAAGLDALARHLERAARAAGRRVVRVGGLPADDAWRELAARAASGPINDPVAVAQALSTRDPGAVFLVVEGARTHWGRAVSAELARLVGDASRPIRDPLVTTKASPHRSSLLSGITSPSIRASPASRSIGAPTATISVAAGMRSPRTR